MTSSRLRPMRSARSPAARLVSAFAAPKATTKARIAALRAKPEVMLADERQHAALEPDHRADERVQPDEQRELARVRAQPEPDLRRHARRADLAGAVGGDDPRPDRRARRQRRRAARPRTRPGRRARAAGCGALEADRRERVAGEAATADRAAVVARIDDDVVRQLEQSPQARVQQRAPGRERRPRRAGPDGRRRRSRSESPLKTSHGSSRPRRRSATDVGVVRRRVTRRRDRGHDGVAELDDVAVRERRRARSRHPPERQVGGRTGALDERRQAGDVVGLHVRLEDGHDRRSERARAASR